MIQREQAKAYYYYYLLFIRALGTTPTQTSKDRQT